MIGFALYKRGVDLYIITVDYEYDRFVGFDKNANVYLIKKLNETQKEWLKNHSVKELKKTLIFVDKEFYLEKISLENMPKGTYYTQLPGGGGVYKETRKCKFVNELFKNETILRAVEKYGIFNEGRSFLKQVIKEIVDKFLNVDEYKKKRTLGFELLKKEVNKCNSSEELLRKGGFSTEALDLAAFGMTEDTIKQLMPNELSIKWKDDLENVAYEVKKSGLSKIAWAKKINLSEPIDVSFDGNKFYIEDGHHRFYAAKVLNLPLNVNLEIKANPIIKLSDKGYDDFHRDFFNKFKKSIPNILKKENPIVSFTAVSIEDNLEKEKINKIFDSLKKQGKIPEDFIRPSFKDESLDYHMTIKVGEIPIGFKSDLDEEVELNIKSIGISEDAIALGISGNYFSANDYQHITIAFKKFPADSKFIKKWIPLKTPFKIKGVIREFSPKKNIIKRGVFKNEIEESNQIQIGNFQSQAVPAGRGSIFPQEK